MSGAAARRHVAHKGLALCLCLWQTSPPFARHPHRIDSNYLFIPLGSFDRQADFIRESRQVGKRDLVLVLELGSRIHVAFVDAGNVFHTA